MRIVFLGTAAFAVPSLSELHRAGHDIVLVVTQPDRLAGRGLRPAPPPIKVKAVDFGLPISQPERIRDEEAQTRILETQPDLLVVVAYGQVLPETLINAPRLGTVNLHASLLPRHRGAAPVEWAILDGDRETGVTIMKMDAGLDTGPILMQQAVAVMADETASLLEDRLAELGAKLLVRTVAALEEGVISAKPQPVEGASYARRLRTEDGKLSSEMSALEIDRRVRALGDRVGVWLTHPAGPIKVFKGRLDGDAGKGMAIATADGVYVVEEVQPAGGRRMSAQAWIRGRR